MSNNQPKLAFMTQNPTPLKTRNRCECRSEIKEKKPRKISAKQKVKKETDSVNKCNITIIRQEKDRIEIAEFMIHNLNKVILIVKENPGSAKHQNYASKLISHCMHLTRLISNFSLLYAFLKIMGDIS